MKMRTDIDQLSYAEKLAMLTKLYLELRLALLDAHRAAEADLLGRPVSVPAPVTFSAASYPRFTPLVEGLCECVSLRRVELRYTIATDTNSGTDTAPSFSYN
jgi:hypothetical protein